MHIEDNKLPGDAPGNLKVIVEEQSVSIFWGQTALAIATLLDSSTIHLKLDLRRLGLDIFEDADGLHIGSNVFSHNHLVNCETAINVGPTP